MFEPFESRQQAKCACLRLKGGPDALLSGIRGEERGNWVRLQVGEINYKGLIKLKELTKPYQQRYGYFFVKRKHLYLWGNKDSQKG